MLSRSPMMSSLGDSGLSVFQAGQADWQRPHSVHVAKSSICFQVKCSIWPTPNTVSSSTFSMSMSGVLSRAPSARGRREKATLMGAMKMCRCFEYDTKTIFLNPKLVASNAVHTYFTVNSVFLDPNIFGRFLALVMILVAAVLLYARRQRTQVASIAALAILWGALVLTVSRSSLGALLVGLGALGAIRWNVGRAVFAAAGVVALAAAAIAVSPTTFGLNQGLNGASSGRPGLVSGGIDLFADRPLWGFGSGSFETEYSAHNQHIGQTLSASHTIPITVAAEQGLIGLLVYAALVLAALVTLFRRCRREPARVAIACAFLALVFHTMLYADFLEDPVTWTLLAIGVALALRPSVGSGGRGSELAAGERELQQQLA